MRASPPLPWPSAPSASSSGSPPQSSPAIHCGEGRRDRPPCYNRPVDVDALNSGYAAALLEEYLENPDAVPSEWRRLFESGSPEVVATHPGLARLIETLRDGDGHLEVEEPVVAPPAPA